METQGPGQAQPDPNEVAPVVDEASPTGEGLPPTPTSSWGDPEGGSGPAPRRSRRYLRAALSLLIVFTIAGVFAYVRRPDPLIELGTQLFTRIPADQRDSLTEDLSDAIGDRLDGKSTQEQFALAQRLVASGYARLGDAQLIRRIELLVKALNNVDEVVCSDFGRASLGSRAIDPEVAIHLLDGLAVADLTEWYQLAVAAAKAEVADSPPARTVPDSEATAIFERVTANWTDADRTTVGSVTADLVAASDHDVCVAIRLVYKSVLAAPDADLAKISLYDIQAAAKP